MEVKEYGYDLYKSDVSSQTIQDFLTLFKVRNKCAIEYNQNVKYEVLVRVTKEYITEVIFFAEDNKHIVFSFSNVNKIDDIVLPNVSSKQAKESQK